MKKVLGYALILTGVVLILISIMGLVKAFDTFSMMGSSTESIGYTFGSIVFPLLLTVSGRWVFRKGLKFSKNTASPGK
jgi:multisubunit Na+/H+ antiporter MnhG subunit